MEWMVLFHDVAKEAKPNVHDYIHAFRSAAITGRALALIGFPVTEAYVSHIEAWATLTYEATIYESGHRETIQDNSKLPAIYSGIDRLFGINAPAGLIIKGVLLHLSLAIDPSYPVLASFTNDEITCYIDSPLYPMLKVMLLVDNDAWNLFDPEQKQASRQQTLTAFDQIKNSYLRRIKGTEQLCLYDDNRLTRCSSLSSGVMPNPSGSYVRAR